MMDFKGSQASAGLSFGACVWYVAYPISYRQIETDPITFVLEEMMQERGVEVDFSRNRWVLKYTPVLGKAFRQRKRPVARTGV